MNRAAIAICLEAAAAQRQVAAAEKRWPETRRAIIRLGHRWVQLARMYRLA